MIYYKKQSKECAMKILNHKLCDDAGSPYPFEASPNYSAGRTLDPQFIVVHYTAGTSAAGSISWLCNKDANASAHFVIGRDGAITQLVRTDKIAWHAGKSSWNDKNYLNSYSIGIEIDNAGRLQKKGDDWCAWTGKKIPNDEVVLATHKNESSESAWHAYTEVQLQALISLTSTLVDKFGCSEILGHDDIAPMRKSDPGPAFPMDSFSSVVLGRSEDPLGEVEKVTKTTSILNIRSGPGTHYDKLEGGPLPKNTRVDILYKEMNWQFVYVVDVINGEADLEGWVYGKYLTTE